MQGEETWGGVGSGISPLAAVRHQCSLTAHNRITVHFSSSGLPPSILEKSECVMMSSCNLPWTASLDGHAVRVRCEGEATLRERITAGIGEGGRGCSLAFLAFNSTFQPSLPRFRSIPDPLDRFLKLLEISPRRKGSNIKMMRCRKALSKGPLQRRHFWSDHVFCCRVIGL